MIPCASCDSLRLLNIRKDSDWGSGGDQVRVNPDDVYEAGDPDTGPLEQDIQFTVCLACGHLS